MPQATLDAFRDHGEVTHSLDEGLHDARSVMRDLGDTGVDYKALTAQLQAEGVQLFADSYRKLLHSLEAHMGRAR
jgi:transaldolase